MKEYALLALMFMVCVAWAYAAIEAIHWACKSFGEWCNRVFEDDDSY